MAVLDRVGLAGDAERPASTLTVASRKRLELARALATRPRLLLLDEVMSGLTPAESAAAVALVRTLNAEGLTVVLVEHVMEVVMPLSRRVAVLDHGVLLAEGPPEVIARDPAVIAAYLGTSGQAAN
jgi:branched-chain amino acid transport system ATP-binding protein